MIKLIIVHISSAIIQVMHIDQEVPLAANKMLCGSGYINYDVSKRSSCNRTGRIGPRTKGTRSGL